MVLNKLTLFILIFSIQFSYSQKVNWVSFEEAVELQKTNPKNIMMDVYTEWCGPCKMMDKNTFENPLIAKFLNDNFYADNNREMPKVDAWWFILSPFLFWNRSKPSSKIYL